MNILPMSKKARVAIISVIAVYGTIMLGMVLAANCCQAPRFAGLTYENQTAVPVQIQLAIVDLDYRGQFLFLDDRSFGDILAPGSTQAIDYGLGYLVNEEFGVTSTYLITAIDAEGDILYRRLFTWHDLEDLDWVVPIIPAQSDLTLVPRGE